MTRARGPQSAGVRVGRRSFVAGMLCWMVGMARAQGVRSFYAQSLQTALEAEHPQLDLLLLDMARAEVEASTFREPERALPMGSLVKPFLAAAYLGVPAAPPIRVVCRGHADRCWMAHGSPDLAGALAGSCNAYFLALAAGLEARGTPVPYLPAPPPDASPADLIGLTGAWRMQPLELLRGYAALLQHPGTPAEVLAGMRGSASVGTAARLGPHPGGVLAKTGTAPCVSAHCAALGEGFVVAAVPADAPRLLLLVHRSGTTGAATAALAGPVLSQLQRMGAYGVR